MATNLPVEKPKADLTDKDLAKIREFVAEGCPGLARLNETDFTRMTEMYMNGSTYWQISNTLNLPRSLIMYVSHTYEWFPARQEYLSELQEKIKSRSIDSKLVSQDFLILLVQAYQKKISSKLKKYLATDNPTHAEEINLKEIDKVFKAIEIIQNLNSDGKTSKGKSPAVALGLEGFSGTIERSDQTLTITPALDKQVGSMLKKFADMRRAEQNKSDIDKNKPKNEEDKNET